MNKYWSWALVCSLWLTGCGVYSFTGTNISPDIKTVSIQRFIDDTGAGPPILSQSFTEDMREFFQRNTTLALTNDEGDLQLDGSITRYDFTPVSPQANALENAALNRLTIAVNVRFVNTKDESQNFESVFSAYEDFPEGQNPQAVEQGLIEIINERIILDVFNRSVANW